MALRFQQLTSHSAEVGVASLWPLPQLPLCAPYSPTLADIQGGRGTGTSLMGMGHGGSGLCGAWGIGNFLCAPAPPHPRTPAIIAP